MWFVFFGLLWLACLVYAGVCGSLVYCLVWIGWLVVGAVCSLVLGLDLEVVFIVGWLDFGLGCVNSVV